MKYGVDYGVKVEVPWYIKCPVVNRFFKTMMVKIEFTTFSPDGAPMIGVVGKARVPYREVGKCLNAFVKVRYAFAEHSNIELGKGLYVSTTLIDVNHRKVYDRSKYASRPSKEQLKTGYHMKDKKKYTQWLFMWRYDYVDITFNKEDFGR